MFQSDPETTRIDFLDGIRGWAALMVVFSHLIVFFLRPGTPEYNQTFLRFISDGRLAVFVFFVLSGYALSVSHLGRAVQKLDLAITARYFRLAIPILCTTLIAYLLLKGGLFFNLSAAATGDHYNRWLGSMYPFSPSLADALQFASFDVFFAYHFDTTYNSSLWTMPIELYGSFLVYAYIAIFRSGEKVYWHVALILAVFLLFALPLARQAAEAPYADLPYFACFILGYLIAELRARFRFEAIHWGIEFLAIAAFSVVVVLSTYRRPENGALTALMAVTWVLAVAYSSILKKAFTNRFAKFLGRISFPLYLIHIPILCSWSSYLYVTLPQTGLGHLAIANVILVSSVLLSLLVAWLLLPVERFSMHASKTLARVILNR